MIAPGSGVVGIEAGEGRTLIYYEGYTVMLPSDLEGRPAYQIWHAAMATAASRMVTDYPTIAAATPRNVELLRIGTYYITSALFDVADTYRDEYNDWIASNPHTKEHS
jgi:hypothetical protein